jgi:hypothetical protein
VLAENPAAPIDEATATIKLLSAIKGAFIRAALEQPPLTPPPER